MNVTESEILKTGYPSYTTSCGWLGYSDEKITKVILTQFIIFIEYAEFLNGLNQIPFLKHFIINFWDIYANLTLACHYSLVKLH